MKGDPGMVGANGLDGVSVTTSAVDAGSLACPYGGTAIVSASGTQFVCNGAPGVTGMTGAPGMSGLDGTSVTLNSLMVGDVNCPAGGTSVTAANGTRFICNGLKGEPGDAGAQGPPGPTSIATCPPGMTRVERQYSTICYSAGTSGSFETADSFCATQFHASLCTLSQWRAVVCRVGIANPGRSWLPNSTGVGSFATVLNCSSDSVSTAVSSSNAFVGPCCLEWMKY